jgi:hypothetical protein
VSPTSLTFDPPQHLAHDHLDVLVVDAHTLEPVDLLDLIDQVLRELLLTEHLEDVVRIGRLRPSALRPPALGHPWRTASALPFGIRYSLGSPTSGRTTTFRFPLVSLPNSTQPSISLMTAWSFGLRASNSSATRGKPPVMSLVFDVSRGIFARMAVPQRRCPRR